MKLVSRIGLRVARWGIAFARSSKERFCGSLTTATLRVHTSMCSRRCEPIEDGRARRNLTPFLPRFFFSSCIYIYPQSGDFLQHETSLLLSKHLLIHYHQRKPVLPPAKAVPTPSPNSEHLQRCSVYPICGNKNTVVGTSCYYQRTPSAGIANI